MSLLGTWSGNDNEKWDSSCSSTLQVLNSIQSIVMQEGIYYNEPGYQSHKGGAEGKKLNASYSNLVKYANICYAMRD